MNKPLVRRLIWDLEVSPNVVYSWRVGYKVSLFPDGIIQERKVICIGYRWSHENTTHCLVWDKNQDDAKMLSEFVEIAKTADELVAHHGDSFDLPWFRGRLAILNLAPLPPVKTVDTRAWAANYMYLNSNKLDYLGEIFGFGKKIKTEFQLWKDVMDGCPIALDRMVRYCKRDVSLLLKVFNRLHKYAPAAPRSHVGVLNGKPKWSCPKCASVKAKKDKTRVSKHGVISHQLQCLSCGHYHSVNNGVFSDYMLHKK